MQYWDVHWYSRSALNGKPLEEWMFPDFLCKCQVDVWMSWSYAILHLARGADLSPQPARARPGAASRVPAQGPMDGAPEGREPHRGGTAQEPVPAAWDDRAQDPSIRTGRNVDVISVGTLRTCGILVPRLGIKPAPPAVEAASPNHWTAREVPVWGSKVSPFSFEKGPWVSGPVWPLAWRLHGDGGAEAPIGNLHPRCHRANEGPAAQVVPP